MSKRKKKQARPSEPGRKQPSEFASRPFKHALAGHKRKLEEAKRSSEAPAVSPSVARAPRAESQAPSALSDADQDALSMAMVGVEPLRDEGPRRITRASAPPQSRTAEVTHLAQDAESRARSRLDALVAGGVSFRVQWSDEFVEGWRQGGDPRVVRRLARRRGADDSLDLHGMLSDDARWEVTRFVRSAYRKGLDTLCIVHGKGLHSDGGQSVLRAVTVEVLTESGCAPCVQAFCTAHAAMGGSGALMVRLKG